MACPARFVCRPKRHQRNLYSGYKKGHGYKFQALIVACGLLFDIYGPLPGRRNDWFMWTDSRLGQFLRALPLHASGKPYYIYGDSGYYLWKDILVSGFKGRYLTAREEKFNTTFNTPRTSVEWGFRSVTQMWRSLNMVEEQKVGRTAVGYQYLAACLLTNFLTCLDGTNQTAAYFNCPPPTLERYMTAERVDRAGLWQL